MLYVSKPFSIRAFQLTRKSRADNSDWPEFMHKAWNRPFNKPNAVCPEDYPLSDGTDSFMVHTTTGIRYVDFGDYIYEAPTGNLVVLTKAEFERCFEQIGG